MQYAPENPKKVCRSVGMFALFHLTGISCVLSKSLSLAEDHVCSGTLLTIPSTRNHLPLLLIIFSTQPESHWVFLASLRVFHKPGFFLLHVVFNRARMLFCDADFLQKFHPQGIFFFVLNGQCHFLRPVGSFFLPYHILSLVCELKHCAH